MRILLIENNKDNLNHLQRFLNILGIESYENTDGCLSALQITNLNRSDLIICNPIVLKNTSTRLFLEQLRNLGIPILWTISLKSNYQIKINLKYSSSMIDNKI